MEQSRKNVEGDRALRLWPKFSFFISFFLTEKESSGNMSYHHKILADCND